MVAEELCIIIVTSAPTIIPKKRFEVALLLTQGMTYHDITEQTGASTATISRVARCLGYGADGYKIALERLDASTKNNE